jgi:hypothetical protein
MNLAEESSRKESHETMNHIQALFERLGVSTKSTVSDEVFVADSDELKAHSRKLSASLSLVSASDALAFVENVGLRYNVSKQCAWSVLRLVEKSQPSCSNAFLRSIGFSNDRLSVALAVS